jgi:hypothetical protein
VISQALINTYDKKKVINIFIAQEYVSWLESENIIVYGPRMGGGQDKFLTAIIVLTLTTGFVQ